MTECSTQSYFDFHKKRKLRADIEGGEITSDAGVPLLRQADESLVSSWGSPWCTINACGRPSARLADIHRTTLRPGGEPQGDHPITELHRV
jgi:hypothetical protein